MKFSSIIFKLSVICSLTTYFQVSGQIYYSQYKQDEFIHNTFFSNKKTGTFIEIGANDGISFSNTYFFEKSLGWTGICVEPMPELFKELQKNRNCTCIKGCITDLPGWKEFLLTHIDQLALIKK